MSIVAERCTTGASHTWSEWRFDDTVSGAVKHCTTCQVTIDRARTVIIAAAPSPSTGNTAPVSTAAVLEALGKSPFSEELRGDFAQAAALADACVASADASTKADALLMRAWVHVLQGNVLAAQRVLSQVQDAYGADANVRLRALSHQLNALHHQFNLFPDRSGVGATEIDARWRGVQDLMPLDQQWNAALASATSGAAQLEARITYGVISQVLPARYMLEARRFSPSDQTDAQALQMALRHPGTLRQIGAALPWPPFAAYADVIDADMHRRAGQHDRALALLQQATDAYRSMGDAMGEALCLMTGADWACAQFTSPIVWNFAMVDSSGPSSALSVPLEALEGDAPPPEDVRAACAAAYDRAATLFASVGARRGDGAIALRRGFLAACSHQDWPAVAQHALHARDAFRAAGDDLNATLATTHLLMAELCGAAAGHDVQALAAEIGAWGATSGSVSFVLGCGILINRLSRDWLTRGGHAERALQCSDAARTLFQTLGARVNAAQCLVDSGLIHSAVGARSTALTCFETALDEYTAAAAASARIAANLRQRIVLLTADVYQLALQATDADGMERSAARMATQLRDLPRDTDLLAVMQAMQARMEALQSGKELPPEPVDDVQDLLVLVPMAKMAESVVKNAAVLAPVYRSRDRRAVGDTAAADRLLTAAEQAVETVPAGEREMLRAVVLAERKEFAAAAVAMRKYIGAGGANAGLGGEIAHLMQQQGGTAAQAELELQQRRSHEQAFAAFVMVQAYDDAALHLQELERRFGSEWWRGDRRPWLPLSNIAELHEHRGELARARACYAQAVEEFEQRRSQLTRDELKVAFASDKGVQYLYLLAARAAVRDGDPSAGFVFAERAKSRALLDLMAVSRAPVPGAEGPEMLVWREQGMQLQLTRGLLAQARAQSQPDAARIAMLEQQLNEGEARQRAAERALAQVNPRFQDAVSANAPVLDLQSVQRALPDGTLLLEYFFVGEDLLAWGVTRTGTPVVHQQSVDVNALARDVAALHRAIDDGTPWQPVAERLATTLLAPFASSMRACRDLVVVPHGATHLLPFHVLPFDGGLLADSHTISYLPSASTLQWLPMHDAEPVASSVLVIGNPTLDLPASVVEAQYVAAQFASSTVLLEHDATETVVRAAIPGAPLIHFATHGVLDETMPLNSALLLANGDELTVYELMLLRLQARLVVLSACSTGQGERTGGDDVLGLTRALLAAGADAAVVSLWPVDDHATALFMQAFYGALAHGVAPRVALQRAQQALRRMTLEEIETVTRGRRRSPNAPVGIPADEGGYRHPYFWAPFVLVGR